MSVNVIKIKDYNWYMGNSSDEFIKRCIKDANAPSNLSLIHWTMSKWFGCFHDSILEFKEYMHSDENNSKLVSLVYSVGVDEIIAHVIELHAETKEVCGEIDIKFKWVIKNNHGRSVLHEEYVSDEVKTLIHNALSNGCKE